METTKKNEGRAGQTLKAETLKAEGGAERGDRLLTKQEMAERSGWVEDAIRKLRRTLRHDGITVEVIPAHAEK